MIKKLLMLVILCVPLLVEASFKNVPSEYRDVVGKIMSLSEMQELMANINVDGPVGIRKTTSDSGGFEAYWDGNYRVVIVNHSEARSEASLIRSIVFELHNASTNKELNALSRLAYEGKIDRNTYVESVEKIEHQNVVRTCKVLESGWKNGTFPKAATWNMPSNFDEYYSIQKKTGHSRWIANKYDSMRQKS